MEVLKKGTVHMKDRDTVEKKLHDLMTGGPSKLQVISDFDLTLSRAHKDGVTCPSTYGVLEQSHLVDEDFKNKSICAYKEYAAKTKDPNLLKEEHVRFSSEMYSKTYSLMSESGISKGDIPEIVKTSNAGLRDGCDAVFELLQKHDVPLLIFSAGIGDIIEELLRQQNLLLSNVKIVANFMRFDEKNKVLGCKGNLIHTFNKNQTSMETGDYFDTLKSRDNIFLIGDSLGDIDMSEGAEKINVVLKVGFLNHRVEELLSDYLDVYDIVLTDDQTMEVVTGLLQNILC